MEKTLFVDPNELEEHKKASALIPEMTDKEWKDFLKNVEKFGIRKPLDVTKDYKILDGRHRAKAAKKLNIESVEVNVHDLSEQEIIKWVRDISIEQKILSPAQKHKIFTDADDFMKKLYEEGKRNKTGRPSKKESLGPRNQTYEKPHNTNDEIGKAIGVSGSTVKRLNAVKKKDPELYEEVVKGDKSAKGAYMELHPPRNKKDKKEQKETGGEKTVKETTSKNKEEETTKDDNPLPINKNFFRFQSDNVSEDKKKELLIQSKHETLKSYIEQIKMLVNSIDDVDKVLDFDKKYYRDNVHVLEKVINSIKENVK